MVRTRACRFSVVMSPTAAAPRYDAICCGTCTAAAGAAPRSGAICCGMCTASPADARAHSRPLSSRLKSEVVLSCFHSSRHRSCVVASRSRRRHAHCRAVEAAGSRGASLRSLGNAAEGTDVGAERHGVWTWGPQFELPRLPAYLHRFMYGNSSLEAESSGRTAHLQCEAANLRGGGLI